MMSPDNPTESLEPERGLIETFQRNPRLTLVAGAITIILATLVAYVPGIRGQFVWDDDYYVTSNRLLRSAEGLQRIWFDIIPPSKYPLPQYYPMTHTSFWFEYHLWGLNPVGYHLTNVILHIGSALLSWLILRRLHVPGAWAAAAIFALHPINVESVAWIAERKNVLSAFFFFASLYIYLRYCKLIAKPPAEVAPDSPTKQYMTLPDDPTRLYAISLLLFILALASKTVTSSLPAVVLLLIWWRRGRISLKNDLVPLLPFFVLGIGAGALTGWMEVHRVGASGPDWDYGFATRCIIAGHAAWFYVAKLIFPHPLVFNYPRWTIDPHDPRQWCWPLAMIAVVVGLWIARKQLGHGPLVAVLYYLGTLFPAMAFINVLPMRYSFVADHFVYLSSIGLIVLATAGVARVATDYFGRERSLGALSGITAVVLVLFFALSNSRAGVFEDSETLWKDTWFGSGKRSWMAANNYGELILRTKPDKLDAAEAWFEKTLELKPDHAEARFNLGLIAERRNHLDEAAKWYHEAIERRPNYTLFLHRLGYVYAQQRRLDEAEKLFRRALELDPQYENAHLSLGMLYERQGKYQEAIKEYEAISEGDPDAAAPYIAIGTLLVKMNRAEEAVPYFNQAAQREPNNPTIARNVGAILASSGRLADAQALFERAIQLKPNFVDARRQLGVVLAMRGKTDEARQQFEIALKIDPESEQTKASLAALNEGRLKPATTQAATQSMTMPSTTQPHGP